MKTSSCKKIIGASMSLLLVCSVGFAQDASNLEQISWDYSKDTALPALSEGYDGYLVSGSLGNAKNYFVAVSQTQEGAQSAYIKLGQHQREWILMGQYQRLWNRLIF